MKEIMYETEEQQERIVLVGVATADEEETVKSLDELEELGQTAGAITVAKVIQNRERFHPGTYIGKGKIEEVRELVHRYHADAVVCDDELSPAQFHNLQETLDVKVIDRTVMILDIFAKRASTSEGKLQVELAQLRYRASHLIGGRSELSRLGGGIGTRGPGEQKLEMDRRLIKERITIVKRELAQVQRTRMITRKKRQANPMPVVAIVGYTNAGKSTLLNRLTGAGVLSEDKLFATLDPTTRKHVREDGEGPAMGLLHQPGYIVWDMPAQSLPCLQCGAYGRGRGVSMRIVIGGQRRVQITALACNGQRTDGTAAHMQAFTVFDSQDVIGRGEQQGKRGIIKCMEPALCVGAQIGIQCVCLGQGIRVSQTQPLPQQSGIERTLREKEGGGFFQQADIAALTAENESIHDSQGIEKRNGSVCKPRRTGAGETDRQFQYQVRPAFQCHQRPFVFIH